jgi:hypothetical protein
MKTMKRISWGALAALTAFSAPAQAAYVFNIEQVGSDVVVTGSGSVNLGAAHYLSTGPYPLAGLSPNFFSVIGVGSNPSSSGYSITFTSPAGGFGNGAGSNATSFTGSGIELQGNDGRDGFLFLPAGYVSGTSLGSSSATMANKTLAYFGLFPGGHVYTFGSGANADSITVNIVTSAVPEPASWALAILGFAGVGGMMRATGRRAAGARLA